MGFRKFGREKERSGELLSDEAVEAIAAERRQSARGSSRNRALILGLVGLLPTVGEGQFGKPIKDLVTFHRSQAYLLWAPPRSSDSRDNPYYVLGELPVPDHEVSLLLVPAYGPPRLRSVGKIAVTAESWSKRPELAARTLARQIGEQELRKIVDPSGNYVLRPETPGNIHISTSARGSAQVGGATVLFSGISREDGGPRWVGADGVPDPMMVEYKVETHLAGLAETFGVKDDYSGLLKQWQNDRSS